MTTEEKIIEMKERLKKMQESPKNTKCPGVMRALRREIRNLEKMV